MKQTWITLLLLWGAFAYSLHAQVLYQENFNGSTFPTNLSIYDNDLNTPGRATLQAYDQWNIDTSTQVHPTTGVAAVTSWYQPQGIANDWLITPLISGITPTTNLRWKAASRDALFSDDYEIWVTTQIRGAVPVPSDFIELGERLDTVEHELDTLTERGWSLVEYAGQSVYIAFRNTTYDGFVLELDDIVVSNDAVGLLHATATSTPSICCAPTGTATAVATGGAPPYSYQWDNNTGNQTTATATNLSPGRYQVSVTDQAGTLFVRHVDVDDQPYLQRLYYEDFEGTGGVLPAGMVALDNDAAPAAIAGLDQWSITNSTIALLATDSVVAVTSQLNPPGPSDDWLVLPLQATSAHDSVVLAWKAATRDPQRRDGYEIWVTPTIAGATPTAVDFINNGYQLYATNAADTEFVAQFAYIYNPTQQDLYIAFRNASNNQSVLEIAELQVYVPCTTLVAKGSFSVASCGQNDGQATVQVYGAPGPYQYQWDAAAGSATTATVTGLAAGSYTVTVTAANGVAQVTTALVFNPSPPQVQAVPFSNYNGQHITCPSASDGEMRAWVDGGAFPYSYQWNTGANTSSLFNLSAGTYTVTITDALGCSAVASGTLVDPPPVHVSLSVNQVSCYAGGDGLLLANATGGAPNYSYQWSSGGNAMVESSLFAGYYTVTVTDANGCTATQGAVVAEPTWIIATASSVSPTSATVVATGGMGWYTYVWSNGSTSITATNLVGGQTHTVTVTDLNGCTATAAVQLPCNLMANAWVTSNYNGADVSCAGAADGWMTASANSGTPPYAYQWNDGSTTDMIGGLGVWGNPYSVIVTDSNGCSDTATQVLTEPVPVIVQASSLGNGDVIATAYGGTTISPQYSYTYQWDAAAGSATTDTVTNLANGIYSVTATDMNGCTATDTVWVYVVNVRELGEEAQIRLYPNPSHTQAQLELHLPDVMAGRVQIINALGQIVWEQPLEAALETHIALPAAQLSSGTYTVLVALGDQRWQLPWVIR